MEIPIYKEKFGNPCIVMNKITCPGCSSVLRYDYGTLLGHASTKHKMNLIEFYNKFFKSTVEPVQVKKTPVKTPHQPQIKTEEEEGISNGNSNTSIKLVPKLKFGTSLSKRAHMWGWRCRYKVILHFLWKIFTSNFHKPSIIFVKLPTLIKVVNLIIFVFNVFNSFYQSMIYLETYTHSLQLLTTEFMVSSISQFPM